MPKIVGRKKQDDISEKDEFSLPQIVRYLPMLKECYYRRQPSWTVVWLFSCMTCIICIAWRRDQKIYDWRRPNGMWTNQALVGEEGPYAVKLRLSKRSKYLQGRHRDASRDHTDHYLEDWQLQRRFAGEGRPRLLRLDRPQGRRTLPFTQLDSLLFELF